MKKFYLIIFLLGLLLIVGCTKNNPLTDQNPNQQASGKTYTVEILADKFSPNEITIKQGDTVIWVNKDTKDSWPASAVHPTHEKYPGSSITKCNTQEQNKIFDACKGLKSGESWSFTFNEKGTWGYHDHIVFPGRTGKVIVE